MKTTKAYVAGLGMAGVVIASILVLLAVGTGVVGFDGAPELGKSKHPLDRVVADERRARSRDGARHVHGGWAWPVATAATGGDGVGSDPAAGDRRKPTARRRAQPRRRSRSVAAQGSGGAPAWTRERLGGGAALGASAARGRRGTGPSGGPDTSGGALAPPPPPDPER